jgi:hypothetical protein
MHLRLCKGIFCRGRPRLTVPRGRSGWAPDVVTFSYDHKEKTDKPSGKDFPLSYLGIARRGRVTV